MDVLLLAVVNEILLDQERVALNLVDSRDNSSALDDSLELQVALASLYQRNIGKLHTCSLVWLETPTARALDLGSSVTAVQREISRMHQKPKLDMLNSPFHVSTMEMLSSMTTSPSGWFPPVRGNRS